MQITCPKCLKKFNANPDLIPQEGRLLQCGSCEHKWHYIKDDNLTDKITNQNEIIKDIDLKKIKEPIINIKKNNQKTNKIKNNNKQINIFKYFIVFLITLISFIILLDTFKIQISYYYPELISLLNSLYETLIDLNLFFIDLIK